LTMKKNTRIEAKRGRSETITSYLSKECRVEGHIQCRGNIRLDGVIKGTVESIDGAVIVGECAVVDANIRARTAIIAGTVHGTIEAFERIEVLKPGSVSGDVYAPTVEIEPGVAFDGKCGVKKG